MRGYGNTGTAMDKQRDEKDTEVRKTSGGEMLRQNMRGTSMLLAMKRDKRGSRKMDR